MGALDGGSARFSQKAQFADGRGRVPDARRGEGLAGVVPDLAVVARWEAQRAAGVHERDVAGEGGGLADEALLEETAGAVRSHPDEDLDDEVELEY